MNKFYVAKGIIYVIIGTVLTPILLEDHPILICIQGALLVALGVMYIVMGAKTNQ